jgi:tape measure domain-containing protein
VATDIETLLARIEVQTTKFERDMARARRDAARATDEIGKDFERTNKKLTRGFDGIGAAAAGLRGALGPLSGALAAAFSVNSVVGFAEAFNRVQNSLKVAGLEGEALRTVYQQLFDVAQRQGAPLEATATLYGRIAAAQKELGVTSQQIINFTEGVGVALRVAGTDSQSASGALLQLGQALGSGVVRAEEFNSVLEGARPILVAVAAGLKEANGSIATLRTLVNDGKVSSAAFFAAFQAGRPVLDDLAKNAVPTISQELNRLRNEAERAAGQLNELIGFTRGIAGVMGTAASAISAVSNSLSNLSRAYDAAAIARGKFIEGGGEQTIQDALAGAFGNVGQRNIVAPPEARVTRQLGDGGVRFFDSDREAERGRARNDRVRQVSINDPGLAVTGASKGGGGGKSAAERISDYDREVAALNKRTEALKLDIATFGLSAQAISKAKVEQELLNAFQKDGVVASETQRQKISDLATKFTEAEASLKSMTDAQEAFKQLQDFTGSTLSSFFSDVVSGGKNAERALSNLVKKLAETALQAVLLGKGPLAGLFGTAGGGGIIGGLFGAFAPGRSLGGRVMAGQPYTVGENGRETFVPSQNGRIINARQSRSSGGGSSVTIVQNISANGDRTVAEIARRAAAEGIAGYDRSLPGRISNISMRAG